MATQRGPQPALQAQYGFGNWDFDGELPVNDARPPQRHQFVNAPNGHGVPMQSSSSPPGPPQMPLPPLQRRQAPQMEYSHPAYSMGGRRDITVHLHKAAIPYQQAIPNEHGFTYHPNAQRTRAPLQSIHTGLPSRWFPDSQLSTPTTASRGVSAGASSPIGSGVLILRDTEGQRDELEHIQQRQRNIVRKATTPARTVDGNPTGEPDTALDHTELYDASNDSQVALAVTRGMLVFVSTELDVTQREVRTLFYFLALTLVTWARDLAFSHNQSTASDTARADQVASTHKPEIKRVGVRGNLRVTLELDERAMRQKRRDERCGGATEK